MKAVRARGIAHAAEVAAPIPLARDERRATRNADYELKLDLPRTFPAGREGVGRGERGKRRSVAHCTLWMKMWIQISQNPHACGRASDPGRGGEGGGGRWGRNAKVREMRNANARGETVQAKKKKKERRGVHIRAKRGDALREAASRYSAAYRPAVTPVFVNKGSARARACRVTRPIAGI